MNNKNNKQEDYPRERLIKICEQAFVDQSKWHDRDSAASQIGIGSCYALLKSGCKYEIQFTENGQGCHTDEDTIWIQFWVKDFMWFELGGNKDGNDNHDYHFYIPTEKKLESCNGQDWY